MNCSPAALVAALVDLDKQPTRVRAELWCGSPCDVPQPGLYSWWVDGDGASDLSRGLGVSIPMGRIYAGQTGATAWPSGRRYSSTLGRRIGRQHIGGNVRGSTLRRTLAGILAAPLELVVLGRKRLDAASEDRLRAWMHRHLEVAVHPVIDRDTLADLEAKMLHELDPPLNLDGMPRTPVRERLAALRNGFHARSR